ncbi:MAG: hypothetical protein G5703_10085, partial [Serratia symbiotica]|nr:hypothetical protein [Serratia symbiotica]
AFIREASHRHLAFIREASHRHLAFIREASHRHLAFIEEVLLDLSREHTRRERSLRRLQQRKDSELFSSG